MRGAVPVRSVVLVELEPELNVPSVDVTCACTCTLAAPRAASHRK
jgi:hypothetical protein